MKSIINRIATLAAIMPVLAMGLIAVTPLTVSANECATGPNATLSVGTGSKCAQTTEQKGNLGNVIQDVTNVLLFIIGAVAVIMIILGGIRYTISNGDSSQITSAKNTILYGVIGVVVALLAFAIVNFVVGAFTAKPSTDGASSATN